MPQTKKRRASLVPFFSLLKIQDVILEAIKKALTKGGNKKVTIKELPNLNHLFQECKTGSPDEYSDIEQTFSPTALTEILKWVQTQTK